MTFIRALRPDEVTVELIAEPQDESPEACLDEEAAEWARDQLRRGNQWGWCTAVVRAKWRDFAGEATLGGCAYRSEEDFVADSGYFDDMLVEAKNDLQRRLEETARALEPLVSRESVDDWLVSGVQEA